LQHLLLELIVTSNLPFNFVDNGVLHKILEYLNPSIRIPELIKHSGNIIGGEVIAFLCVFGIPSEKIGYFTFYNAENNTIAMVAIGQKLGFDGRLHRGRCIGHIINVTARSGEIRDKAYCNNCRHVTKEY
jgi:hypothetical protein